MSKSDGVEGQHMALVDKIKGLSTKTKIILSSAIVVVIAAVVIICVLLSKGGYTATTMRLLRVEGTVNIEDGTGKEKPVIDNIRFQSGDALNTGADGLASVGLDDTKIVTLQNDSRAEFQKKKKKLELKLTKGALFFEVTEKLNDDESFEIKTSTMTVGIRGTSGYVFCDEEGRPSIIITEGKVHIVARNPDTGEVKETDCAAGHKVTVYTFNDRTTDTVDFKEEEIEVDDLNQFTLKMLAENEDLLKKVCEATGWSREEILALAEDPYKNIPDPTESSSEESSDPGDTSGSSETSEPSESSSESSEQDPSETSEPSETPTPTPKPKKTPTPTPKPTASPTPDPSKESSEPSRSSESSEPSKSSESSEPSKSRETSDPNESKETELSYPEPDMEDLPEDADPMFWGDETDTPGIYIYAGVDDMYYGYVNGEWVEMREMYLEGDGYAEISYVYGEENNPIVYYSYRD